MFLFFFVNMGFNFDGYILTGYDTCVLFSCKDWVNLRGTADAILDRVVHTAHTVELKGPSMRKPQVKNSGQNLPPCD